MKQSNDKKEIILLGIITIVLIIGLGISIKYNDIKKTENSTSNKQNSLETKEELKKEEINESKEEEKKNHTSPNSPSKTTKPTSESPVSPNPSSSSKPESTKEPPTNTHENTDTNPTSPEKTEQNVVVYFEELNNMVTPQAKNDTTYREKVKNAFTTVIDFIFYGKTIKGYTFKELTNTAKLKVIKIALTIDHKIDSYFPDYKATMKEKMTDLKGKAALLYLDITSSLCTSVGESACKEARQDFKNMKESFGFTWEIIKNAGKSSYNSLKTILNEWYQSIK